jgi:hypothetical protein
MPSLRYALAQLHFHSFLVQLNNELRFRYVSEISQQQFQMPSLISWSDLSNERATIVYVCTLLSRLGLKGRDSLYENFLVQMRIALEHQDEPAPGRKSNAVAAFAPISAAVFVRLRRSTLLCFAERE